MPKPEFRNPHAPPGILDAFAERDKAQEQLARDILSVGSKSLVELLGPAGQRPAHATTCAVGTTGKHASLAPLEQLGQRILEQRQRPRLRADIAHHLRHQLRLGRHARAPRRRADRLLQLIRVERQHHLGAGTHQLAQLRVTQRPVVEVGAQRDYDPHP